MVLKQKPKLEEQVLVAECTTWGGAREIQRKLENRGFKDVKITDDCDVVAKIPEGIGDLESLYHKMWDVPGVFQLGTSPLHNYPLFKKKR